MIDISLLTQDLQEKLNSALLSETANNAVLNNDRVEYAFLIHTDGGEYKDFNYVYPNGTVSINEQTNKIIKYINGEFDVTGSQSDGVSKVEMTINARIELLIPLINAGKKKAKLELVNTIRQIIDTTFRLNNTGQISDGNTIYNYGVAYRIADTGDRDKRAEIGDSILLNVYLTYFIVEMGINSEDFKLYIDGQEVFFTRIGFNRSAQNDSNVVSDSGISGKNYPISTVFGLNFDMPLRSGYIGEWLMDYAFSNNKVARLVKITRPSMDGEASEYYLMLFNEVSLNGEKTKFASVSVIMVEADETVNDLSAYAQEHWGV